ncbi:methyl-accepting chemotaxis protein [Geomonas sp. Red69]|uniref:Methyl-accepting chemotaxis protein n=2 Tax=Geomonas diazotrophica TaxID=2843197 RepID=A0ABX8JN04_9BACT|nr:MULTISPECIES: methyl-accepting chemotaxis protein [Geomonas]MBU5635772.1 methyl-accepting chemotaxis protein [Geomonas diazotrophica]QWV97992.1 methyl-accepting chemotaxis protein [Geomonas nitrogeniifigens]QXE88801.1 methyl-accepting chemotaxis protein [Geomonas nitrogeniifigens]
MLQNLRIRTKLMLMMAVPVLGMVVFSIYNASKDYAALQGLVQTQKLTTLAVQVGELSHQIQKERGYTSGYLNAKGGKFKEELAGQRAKVDREIQSVASFLEKNGASVALVKASLDAAGNAIGRLKETRSGIDTLQVTGGEAYTFYTGLINSYMDVVAAVATTSGKREVMRQATAYYSFVKAKEETGKERATLNAVLAADVLDQERLQRTMTILAAQQDYLDLFRKFASPQAVAAYEEKAKAPVFGKVEEIRGAVLSKGLSGHFGIPAENWFPVITEKIDTMKQVEDVLTKEILATAGGLAHDARLTLILSLVLAAAASLGTCLLGVVISLGITRPLSRMLVMLKDIAEGEGDLTKRLEVGRKDELGEVSTWFNRFIENVHGIVSQLSRNTGQLSVSCQQLSATAVQIATAAEEVAAQSGTVATASEEMSATSNDISSNCSQAAESSNRASDTARGGAQVVQQTLVGMQKIAERVKESAQTVQNLGARSDEIGAIVGTIEDIADQTNLLALNAAIEAARAGEQGRGFAVVADEVRALAERTTRATKEIGAMIKAIQKDTSGAVGSMTLGVQEVESGMESSRRSGEALDDILNAINELTSQIHQIATAAEQQTAVTGEITANIGTITEVVSETAGGAHETADAATHMSALASELQQIVGRFKLA